MLQNCDPLNTARQFLRRWAQSGVAPADVAMRVLADAGLEPDGTLTASLRMLLGGSHTAAPDEATLKDRTDALFRVICGLASKRAVMPFPGLTHALLCCKCVK